MNSQSTSFIPQRPTLGKVKDRGVRKIYILTYISYILFFSTLIAAAGTFLFTLSLESQLTKLRTQLAAEKDLFSQSDIESIRELDDRITIAKARMDQHISVFSIFEALEQNAIQSLQYIGFSYIRSNDLAPVVTVTGRTENFDSVLFQREVLASNSVLAGSSFNETSLATNAGDEESNRDAQKVITFVFEKSIDPSTVGYVPRLTAEEQGVNAQAGTSTEEAEIQSAEEVQDSENQ